VHERPGGIIDVNHLSTMPMDAFRVRAAAFPLRALRALGYQTSLFVRPSSLRAVYLLGEPRWIEPSTLLGIAVLVGLVFAVLWRRARESRALPFVLLAAGAIAPP